MIEAEADAGATTPALLKGHRADVLAISANILLSGGRFSEALPPLEENAAYYGAIGDTDYLSHSLIGLGLVYSRRNRGACPDSEFKQWDSVNESWKSLDWT